MSRLCSEDGCSNKVYSRGLCFKHFNARRESGVLPPISRSAPISELTPRQAEIMGFIQSEHLRTGLPPVVRQIMQQFGLRSPNGVMCHINALRRKGLIHASGANHLNVRIRPVVPEGCCPCCRRPLDEPGSRAASVDGPRMRAAK